MTRTRRSSMPVEGPGRNASEPTAAAALRIAQRATAADRDRLALLELLRQRTERVAR